MNADLSPALAASNTIETLAPQNIFEAAEAEVLNVAGKIEAEAAKVEDKIESVVEADIIAPVENFVAAAEAEVKKVYEKIVHPEVGVTRPVLNHTVATSVIKNPA